MHPSTHSAVESRLAVVANDIEVHPECLREIGPALLARAREVTKDVVVTDRDVPLDPGEE